MTLKSRAAALIIVQILLCILVFPYHWLHGFDSSFCGYGDGLKNSFTYLQFIEEPIGEKGIFYFSMMQYPYGDYVFTADNTPLIAVILRFIHHYLFPVAPVAVPIFNIIMIGNIVFCSWLLFQLLRRYIGANYWAFAAAILVPWLLIQVLRLPRGHYNLSLSSVFVFAWWLCQKYYDAVRLGRKGWKQVMYMALSTFAAFLLHGYYLPILMVMYGGFLFLCALRFAVKHKKWSTLLQPFVYTVLAGSLSYGLIYLTDGYMHLRTIYAQGYGHAGQTVVTSYLFQSMDFLSIHFPISNTATGFYGEPAIYMGHVFWVGFAFVIFASLFSTTYRRAVFASQKKYWQYPVTRNITLIGLVSFVIAHGDYVFDIPVKLQAIPLLGFSWSHIGFRGIVALLALASFGCLMVYSVYSFFAHRRVVFTKKDGVQLSVLLAGIIIMILFLFTNIVPLYRGRNLINPFFYIHKFTRVIEQFRSICRFAWPFLIVLNVWLVYTLVQTKEALSPNVKRLLVATLVLFAVSQWSDMTVLHWNDSAGPNYFSKKSLADIPVVKNPEAFCAIYPLPYFVAGSEDYNVTIDDIDDFSTTIFRIASKYKLPLMAVKLSRTPPVFSDRLISIIHEKRLDDTTLALMPEKPVLVIIDRNYLATNDSSAILNMVTGKDYRPKAYQINREQFDFVNNPSLEYLYRDRHYDFYRWNVHDRR